MSGYTESQEREYRTVWNALPLSAREVLGQLITHGPTWDGDVVSKQGRDALLSVQPPLAVKVVLRERSFGYQAATYRGAHVYTVGTGK